VSVTAEALPGVPEVGLGHDLAATLSAAAAAGPGELREGDVLVVAHKIVSKSEGRIRRLADVKPTERAVTLADEHGKDPRHMQVVLDESAEVLRAVSGVFICVTQHGFVCANAGVDASNAAEEDSVILLPLDPDRSARTLRARLRDVNGAAPAVVITDSFGRAWRHGQVDVAIGCAGLSPLDDWRGRPDSAGRELRATWIALADEVAAAADLVRGKDSREPAVVVRGLERHVTADDGPGAAALRRPATEDLFR
jgi:coenzyme F420-0:L-glutamate ligase / coenzyme F420-1:gamma-L-glutamate ligase